MWSAEKILKVLDGCCENFTFPMLDNGYVYPAATRLTLFRSRDDWAIAIEVFGFSPRSGMPDTAIYSFSSRPLRQKTPDQYVSRQAYEQALADHPYDELQFVYPVETGDWQDAEDTESLAKDAREVTVRGQALQLPPPEQYAGFGIELENAPQVAVFEMCRYLAGARRNLVLATDDERRCSVPAELKPILQLDEWNHPDLAGQETASDSETFQQLAQVLTTGNTNLYQPSLPPNTHWSHWPEGGTL